MKETDQQLWDCLLSRALAVTVPKLLLIQEVAVLVQNSFGASDVWSLDDLHAAAAALDAPVPASPAHHAASTVVQAQAFDMMQPFQYYPYLSPVSAEGSCTSAAAIIKFCVLSRSASLIIYVYKNAV